MAETIKFLSYAGLSQYDGLIKGYVDDAVNAVGVETAKAFKAVALEGNVLHFYLEDPRTEESVAKYSVTLPFADYQVLVKTAVAGNIATFDENGQVVDSGIAMADVATKAEVKEVSDALAEYKTANDVAVKANADAIAVLNGEDTVDGSVAKAVKDAKDALQAEIDAHEEYVGTIPEEATATDVVSYIIERTSGIATDAALSELTEKVTTAEEEIDTLQTEMDAVEAKAQANEDAIAVLNGDGEGSVSKQVADAVAGIVNGAPEAYNTLKEISDWIEAHPAGVAELNTAIKANADAIDALETLVGTLPEGETDVVAYVQKLVKAEEDRAKGVESGFDTRLTTLEEKFTGEGSVESQIATAKQEAIDAAAADATTKANTAEENAKKHADDLNTAMNTRVEALEAIDHDHENKEVLDGITAEKVAAWDAAEQNAKDHADTEIGKVNAKIGEVPADKTVVQMIADAQTEATYDDTEVKADIAALEESLAEGGATANAIKAAQNAADKAQGEVDALEELHATDKAALDAKDAELQAAIEAIQEIPASDINALFGITE